MRKKSRHDPLDESVNEAAAVLADVLMRQGLTAHQFNEMVNRVKHEGGRQLLRRIVCRMEQAPE